MSIKSSKIEKLKRKPYRAAYLEDKVKGWIVHQIKVIRQQRGWTQADLADASGTTQSVIARSEDPDYGKWNISTLLEYANAFDVALEVRFVDWPTFLSDTDDTSPEAMEVSNFEETVGRLTATSDSASSVIMTLSSVDMSSMQADLVWESAQGITHAVELKQLSTGSMPTCRTLWMTGGTIELSQIEDTGTATTGGSELIRYVSREDEHELAL